MSEETALKLGWREWVHLPELNLPVIKAKVDTGARTSCLHAFKIERFEKEGAVWLRFFIHPVQDDDSVVHECEAKLVDERMVSDSGGHKESRPVIATLLRMGDKQWPIEVTLTSRDSMRFRMLLGRTGMPQGTVVYPALSYLQPEPTRL